MTHIAELEAYIQRFRKTLLCRFSDYQVILQNLQTIPGIVELSAAMVLVEIGDDLSTFGTPDKMAFCPGQNESAGKRKSAWARKGNPYLRRILCEAANDASRTRCGLEDKFKGLLMTRAKARYFCHRPQITENRVFVDPARRLLPGCRYGDFEALTVQRNAPRWIEKLIQYGYITP